MGCDIIKIFCGGMILAQFAVLPCPVLAGQKAEPVDGPPEIVLQEDSPPPEARTANPEQPSKEVLTISGKVNDNYQLVAAGGEVYEIAETEAGDNMVGHVGEAVVAKGRVSVIDEQKVLSVISFEAAKPRPR